MRRPLTLPELRVARDEYVKYKIGDVVAVVVQEFNTRMVESNYIDDLLYDKSYYPINAYFDVEPLKGINRLMLEQVLVECFNMAGWHCEINVEDVRSYVSETMSAQSDKVVVSVRPRSWAGQPANG